MQNKDAKTEYADIIDLPHHQSTTRPHMSLSDRAAQFAPFAALSGYDEMVGEEARLTESERPLSEEETEALNERMAFLADELAAGRHPRVTLTHFLPDSRKSGGRYTATSGTLKKLDLIGRLAILYGSEAIENRLVPPVVIPIDRISQIQLITSEEPDIPDAFF